MFAILVLISSAVEVVKIRETREEAYTVAVDLAIENGATEKPRDILEILGKNGTFYIMGTRYVHVTEVTP